MQKWGVGRVKMRKPLPKSKVPSTIKMPPLSGGWCLSRNPLPCPSTISEINTIQIRIGLDCKEEVEDEGCSPPCSRGGRFG